MACRHLAFALCAAALAAASPLGAAQLQLVVPFQGEAQSQITEYECEDSEETFSVTYINAHPDFLAIVPVEDQPRIFVAVIAASGVRYVSGEYEWWTQGNDATLADVRAGEDAKPLTCHAMLDIP
ncbi:MliC family protein [Pelagibacterium montanilacus]|uniref:MliC family protein n=1 Tax=Pelagibacterium montanilacus TaxID=2185280 RepID=UPI0013DFCD46|nr:MliC family protein [Pelagibacterium montanilacus]